MLGFTFVLRQAPKDLENICTCDKGSQYHVAVANLSLGIDDNERNWKKASKETQDGVPDDSTLRGHCNKLLRVKLELATISQISKYKVYREYQSFPRGWK